MRHRKSESVLSARVWRTGAIVRPEDCERQARIWRPDLPRLAAGEIVQSNALRLAGDYDSRLTVGVRASARAVTEIGLSGHALAFGSAARSCLLLAFSTFASGPDARRSIADRLAVIVPTAFLRARPIGIERRVVVPAQ